MKILYAANKNYHSKIQLERVIPFISDKFNIKYAGYRGFVPNKEIDWTLDFLLKDNKYLFNNNRCFNLYIDQIKKFNPDLIISDLEIYTSIAANILNIDLWHVSSGLLKYGIFDAYKYYTNFCKYYKFSHDPLHSHQINKIIKFAKKNYIYSYFGDMLDAPVINKNFDWIKPYHVLGKKSVPCKHLYVAVDNDQKEIVLFLKNKKDVILFSENKFINFPKIEVKKISQTEEYACNLHNCNIFVCDGSTTFLADAFYNEVKMQIIPNYNQNDSLINYLMYQNIYSYTSENGVIAPIKINENANNSFLHQELERFYNEKFMSGHR